MKLPFSFGFAKKEKIEYFLALLLRDEKVNAVIFAEIEAKIRVVGEDEEVFSDSIESVSPDELLEILDQTISKAESSLPKEVETQKTIFGVKDEWVEKSQIKKDYLVRLKRISDELGLAPIGFLIITEAIAHLLAKQEGAPVSAILVEVGNKKIGVSLIRAGRIIETKRTRIEDSLATTTDRLLFHFTSYEVLPSRILILNGKGDKDLSQEFISHSWSKSLPFLHVPQITVLPHGLDAKAMLFGAATQMGFELLQKEQTKQIPHTHPAKLPDQQAESKKPESQVETSRIEEEILGDFGFVKESDIRASSKIEEVEEKKQEVPTPEKIHQETPITVSLLTRLNKIFSQIFLGTLKNIPAVFSCIHLPEYLLGGSKKTIFIVPLMILGLICLLLLYVFTLSAKVILSVTPKIVEKSQAVVFSTDSTDLSHNTVKIEPISVAKSASLSTSATGTKETGDHAKGLVIIYYNNPDGAVFPKGTIIKAPSDLQFSLDDSVDIASASGDASSIDLPITKKVSVTAVAIGKESNLPSGTKFTFGSQSTSLVVAKNDSAFSGGSKKEVTVVAKADLDKLTEEIQKNTNSAKDALAQKIPKGKKMISEFVKTDLSEKEFDKKAGEEAKSIILKTTITYQAFLYAQDDLDKLTKTSFQDNKNSITPKRITYEIKNVKPGTDKKMNATILIKASLLPKLDTQAVTKNIAGKSFPEAEDILLKLPQASTVQFQLSPPLPFPKILPRIPTNIKIEIES